MPPWLRRLAELVRRVPWQRVRWDLVWRGGRWLVRRGRDLLEQNLTQRERRELVRLLQKSKGRRRNLTPREQTRLRNLVVKALRGD